MTNTAKIIQTISKALTLESVVWFLKGESKKALYDILSANDVKGRSRLTKKEDIIMAIIDLITSGATLRSEPINKREPLDIKKLAAITDDNALSDELNKYKVAELKDVLKLYRTNSETGIIIK